MTLQPKSNFISSPNRSSRIGTPISMLVLHATVGDLQSSLGWLCNPKSKVSTHYLISKAGTIYHLVPDDMAAWHAGISSWNGKGSNEIQRSSIGIELENANDGHDPYPQIQLDTLLGLSHWLVMQHRIEADNVVRHLDIAIPKGRKSDPAGFPWEWYKTQLFNDTRSLWRVSPRVTAGAVIRTRSSQNSPSVGILHSSDAPFRGEVVGGALVNLPGFDPSAEWVKTGVGYIWRNLLDEVRG